MTTCNNICCGDLEKTCCKSKRSKCSKRRECCEEKHKCCKDRESKDTIVDTFISAPLQFQFTSIGPAASNFSFFPYLGTKVLGREPKIIRIASLLAYGSALVELFESDINGVENRLLAFAEIPISTDIISVPMEIVGRFPFRSDAILFFRVSTDQSTQILITAMTFGL